MAHNTVKPVAYGIRDRYGNVYDCHPDQYGEYVVPLYDDLDAHRNDVIEEVALAIEKFKHAFGNDTITSFTVYVRGLKHDT